MATLTVLSYNVVLNVMFNVFIVKFVDTIIARTGDMIITRFSNE